MGEHSGVMVHSTEYTLKKLHLVIRLFEGNLLCCLSNVAQEPRITLRLP